jgi:acyl-CoA dehydrogenase
LLQLDSNLPSSLNTRSRKFATRSLQTWQRIKGRTIASAAASRRRNCCASIEPAQSGSDAANAKTKAVLDGDEWVLNGNKTWCSGAHIPGTLIVLMARTSPGKREAGVTAFIVERGTPGFIIEREIAMIGGKKTYELVFEDCRVPARNVLGGLGAGYAPMQLRLNVRRLQMGARCVGIARRALEMMCSHAKQRVTFGAPLADRQAIQWWIADAATKIHACRLMVMEPILDPVPPAMAASPIPKLGAFWLLAPATMLDAVSDPTEID